MGKYFVLFPEEFDIFLIFRRSKSRSILELGISDTLTFISWKKMVDVYIECGGSLTLMDLDISLTFSLRLSFIELALMKTRNIVLFGSLENKTYLKIDVGLINHVPTKTTNIQSMMPRKLRYQEIKTYPIAISTYKAN